MHLEILDNFLELPGGVLDARSYLDALSYPPPASGCGEGEVG
jgi:hypothetical protein